MHTSKYRHHPRMMKRSQDKTGILVNFVYNQKSGIIKSRLPEFWSIWLCLCTHFDTTYLLILKTILQQQKQPSLIPLCGVVYMDQITP